MQTEFLDKNRKTGRPAFKPTQTMRNQVEIAIAGGLSTSEIAHVLGISRPTLLMHFRDELRHGRARRHAEVLLWMHRAAQRGSVSAMKVLLRVYAAGNPEVGKKARLAQAASGAGAGTEWADILKTQTDESLQ